VAFAGAPAPSAPASAAAADRGVVYHVLTWFGVGRGLAHTVGLLVTEPLVVVAVLIGAWVLSRMERRLSARIVGSLRLVPPLVRATPRGSDRARTLAGVFDAVFRTVIWVTALLMVLAQLDLHLAPFVATATIVGAALGFGAQTLVKDFLSGLLIIAEDQYGVGDTIELGDLTATVEGLTLRVTRLRGLDGVVWYVPNGDIRTVGNHSEGTSQAVVDLQVPAGTDLALAGRLAEDEGRQMAASPEWSAELASRPVFVGVLSASASDVTLRLMAATAPGHHFRVANHLRLRVLERWRREGVAWSAETPEQLPGDLSTQPYAPSAATGQGAGAPAAPEPGPPPGAVTGPEPAGGDEAEGEVGSAGGA